MKIDNDVFAIEVNNKTFIIRETEDGLFINKTNTHDKLTAIDVVIGNHKRINLNDRSIGIEVK